MSQGDPDPLIGIIDVKFKVIGKNKLLQTTLNNFFQSITFPRKKQASSGPGCSEASYYANPGLKVTE